MVHPFVTAPNFVSVTPSMGVFFPLLRRGKVSTRWSSFFLSFICFANCILGILSFWANICLSVNAYHVCSFVIGLPHSGWYPPEGSIPYVTTKPRHISYARKILMTGPWHSSLLWGYANAWQIQKWMLTVMYWMEHRGPNEGARESTQGAKGVCNPIGGTTIWTNQYLPELCL